MKGLDLFIVGMLGYVAVLFFLLVMAIKEQNDESRACRTSGGVPVLTTDSDWKCVRGAQ